MTSCSHIIACCPHTDELWILVSRQVWQHLQYKGHTKVGRAWILEEYHIAPLTEKKLYLQNELFDYDHTRTKISMRGPFPRFRRRLTGDPVKLYDLPCRRPHSRPVEQVTQPDVFIFVQCIYNNLLIRVFCYLLEKRINTRILFLWQRIVESWFWGKVGCPVSDPQLVYKRSPGHEKGRSVPKSWS